MTASILFGVSKSEIASVVPRPLQSAIASINISEPLSLVVFRERLVRAGSVKRALRKVTPSHGNPIVMLGKDFTAEARALAEASGAQVISKNHFGWTESTYDEIHAVIASPKKYPS